jgi:hypothetical protein
MHAEPMSTPWRLRQSAVVVIFESAELGPCSKFLFVLIFFGASSDRLFDAAAQSGTRQRFTRRQRVTAFRSRRTPSYTNPNRVMSRSIQYLPLQDFFQPLVDSRRGLETFGLLA